MALTVPDTILDDAMYGAGTSVYDDWHCHDSLVMVEVGNRDGTLVQAGGAGVLWDDVGGLAVVAGGAGLQVGTLSTDGAELEHLEG